MELRLERIERAVDTLPKARTASLSEEDIAAYHRVRSALWEDGTCGINETSPCVIPCRIIDKVCHPIPICRVCDVECMCGPCMPAVDTAAALRGGASRFGSLGR
jgi:hypothetical protein